MNSKYYVTQTFTPVTVRGTLQAGYKPLYYCGLNDNGPVWSGNKNDAVEMPLDAAIRLAASMPKDNPDYTYSPEWCKNHWLYEDLGR